MLLLFFGCEDEPGDLGSNLIPDEDYLSIEKVNSFELDVEQNSSVYSDTSLSFGTAPRTLLGRINEDNFSAKQLLRWQFTFDDTLQEAIEANNFNIISSKIKMHYVYWRGEESAEFDFTVHKINKSWSWQDFNKDSLEFLDYDAQNLSEMREVDQTDSTITFNFDEEITRTWLKERLDQDTYDNFGIIIIPTENSNRVLGFSAQTGISLEVIVENPGVKTDTVESQLIWDTHVVEGEIIESTDNNLILQSGIPVRAKLWMDVHSMLPENASINKAELELFVDDNESSVGTKNADSLYVSLFADSTEHSVYNFVPSLLTRSENKLFGDVTDLVQYLISLDKNNGFRLMLIDEIYAASKFALRSSDYSDKALRPRLTVYYTKERN